MGTLASLVLLVPCFWQPRIQAGDLSSHIYNAWLAQLIERGQAAGLTLAPQSNNVLFDLMLSGLMRAFGASAAQRIAVSVAVLVFFWGAFAFVWSSSRRGPRNPPWQLAPCLAMLAYGWVFHMGLFNFYMSLGLCFGAMALVRLKKRWTMAVAILLLGIAYVAHALPAAWSVGVLVYARLAQALAPRRRVALMIGTLAALALVGFVLGAFFPTRRGMHQLLAITGADQVWIYGRYYVALSLAVLAVWALCFESVLRMRGVARTLLDVRFQVCALCAAALVLLPGGVLLPGFRSALDYIAERMSLAGAVLFCAMVASVRLPKPLVGAMAVIALVFFGLSYADERALNRVETEMERAVAQLPPGQRVVSVLADPERHPVSGPRGRPHLRRAVFQLCQLRARHGAVPRARGPCESVRGIGLRRILGDPDGRVCSQTAGSADVQHRPVRSAQSTDLRGAFTRRHNITQHGLAGSPGSGRRITPCAMEARPSACNTTLRMSR
jgi:hypothetical protein